MQRLQGHRSGSPSRMRDKHLREWRQEHQAKEAAVEAEEEGEMSEPEGRDRGTEEKR